MSLLASNAADGLCTPLLHTLIYQLICLKVAKAVRMRFVCSKIIKNFFLTQVFGQLVGVSSARNRCAWLQTFFARMPDGPLLLCRRTDPRGNVCPYWRIVCSKMIEKLSIDAGIWITFRCQLGAESMRMSPGDAPPPCSRCF